MSKWDVLLAIYNLSELTSLTNNAKIRSSLKHLPIRYSISLHEVLLNIDWWRLQVIYKIHIMIFLCWYMSNEHVLNHQVIWKWMLECFLIYWSVKYLGCIYSRHDWNLCGRDCRKATRIWKHWCKCKINIEFCNSWMFWYLYCSYEIYQICDLCMS